MTLLGASHPVHFLLQHNVRIVLSLPVDMVACFVRLRSHACSASRPRILILELHSFIAKLTLQVRARCTCAAGMATLH